MQKREQALPTRLLRFQNFLPLEVKLQGELKLSGSLGASYLAEGRVGGLGLEGSGVDRPRTRIKRSVIRTAGEGPDGMVKGVERFESELQLLGLCEKETLVQA
jgi:hypothetical protein